MFRPLTPVERKRHAAYPGQGWYPPGLRSWNLVLFTLLCWGFIIALQYFLHKSQTEGGVIFASDINDLPLRQSFIYLYLPTIIAVTFSIYVVWVDNDVKRYEPYRQLSKSGGAQGKDSLLLHYPFDFIPTVPFIAAKRGHFLVFWASLATVLTNFGVVPLQAGLFSTQKVTRTFDETFALSDRFIHSSAQESGMDLSYAFSAYGITMLNETLPPFMTRNYTLAPFAATSSNRTNSGTWTANTTLYSMELECEPYVSYTMIRKNAFETYNRPITFWADSRGCSQGDERADAIIGSISDKLRVKTFSTNFKGYGGLKESRGPFGSQLRESNCNRTMTALFYRNRASESAPVNNVTAISCRPSYYENDVEATVDAITKAPLELVYLGQRRNLSEDLFNTTVFERALYSGYREFGHRSDSFMGQSMPRYLDALSTLDVTPVQKSVQGDFHPMTAMALTTSQRPVEDFLDPRVMKDAYASIYRLLFARAMVDILKTDFSSSTQEALGRRLEHTEAVTLNPIFTYLVEGLLAAVSISAIALLYIVVVCSRDHTLRDDPGSLAATMSMVADSTPLLTSFEDLDCCSNEYMRQKLRKQVYALESDKGQTRITEILQPTEAHQTLLEGSYSSSTDEYKASKPTRPGEFRWFTAVPFTALFGVLMILLSILFVKSQSRGLPLPSRNPVIQNLLTQYLPTATATSIEPMWLLINRLLCVLQPFEELRGFKASASKSLSLNYASLPPQLTILKAARAGHFILALVCAMALLSNLLSTSFAGLFFRDSVSVNHPAVFSPPFEAQFVAIKGTSGPSASKSPVVTALEHSGAYRGGTGEEQFLVSVSNYTRNTSLPSWVDDAAMYLPFKTAETTGKDLADTYRARTKYFSATPNCKPLRFGEQYFWRLWNTDLRSSDPTRTNSPEPKSIFEVQVLDTTGTPTTCYAPRSTYDWGAELGENSHTKKDAEVPCPSGKTSADLLTTLDAAGNASEHDWATCRSAVVVGWMRTTQGDCSADTRYGKIPEDFEEASSNNTFLMTCQPTISIGDADVHVDSRGVLQSKASNYVPDADQSPDAMAKYFTNGSEGLIAQSNLYLFRGQYSRYHNDSFASEYLHFFINRAAGNLRLTDPNQPLPTYEDVEKPLEIAYARLFAIWLGINQDKLLVEVPKNATAKQVEGMVVREERRLFLTFSMFIISEVILGIYFVASILVFLHRPGRYLSRLPTSIAATVALFASSAAVKDLRDTSSMTNKERDKYLDDLDHRYGYGSYVGSDGAVHVGVEKEPYVRYMEEVTFVGSRVEREMRKRMENLGEKKEPRIEWTVIEV